jgi:hypothetical protein
MGSSHSPLLIGGHDATPWLPALTSSCEVDPPGDDGDGAVE